MKTRLTLSAMRIAILGLAVAVGISVHAEQKTTAPVGKKKKAAAAGVPTPSTGTASAVGLLDRAYGLLRRADHDYKGHRVRAMHQIEDAAKELGTPLSGGGKGDEAQGTSDSQLHSAQSLLQQAVGGLTGKAHHHAAEALKQLGIALNIK